MAKCDPQGTQAGSLLAQLFLIHFSSSVNTSVSCWFGRRAGLWKPFDVWENEAGLGIQ